MKAALAASLLALAFAMAGPASAAERLDDSASPRSRVPARVVLSEEGRSLAESRNPTRATIHFGRVEYKLATARYVGKRARIYFVVPALIPGLRSPAGMRLEWRGTGLFADGAGRPGDRRLVWSGLVPGPWMAEALDLTCEVELRALQLQRDGQFGFESYFEIEVLP
jgi:hypothetical protein